MAVDAMAVTDAEHPQALDPPEVLHTDETVLVRFRLRGDETLSGLYSEGVHDRRLVKREGRFGQEVTLGLHGF